MIHMPESDAMSSAATEELCMPEVCSSQVLGCPMVILKEVIYNIAS
jgi:hypothetical protein